MCCLTHFFEIQENFQHSLHKYNNSLKWNDMFLTYVPDSINFIGKCVIIELGWRFMIKFV